MEGRTPIPAPATPPGGAFSSLAHSCPVEPKYVHPYIYIVFIFPFLRRGLRFYSILSFLFFRLYVWSCGFFLSFFLGLCVFAFLGLCVFGRMTYAVTSMLSPSIEKPGTRVLAFRVAAHHVCISGFGCRGKLRFLTGYTTPTTYTLPYNVLRTL